MISGKVKWFNKTKGYGFICPEDSSEDVFIHVTVLEKIGMRSLDEEQHVEFETEIKNGRLRAINIAVEGHEAVEITSNISEDSPEEAA